jgi:adenylate cyclase
MDRRLAAIFAADMVGYSRLMAADEAGTIERQKTHRAALIDPKIAQYGGRIVNTTGDGVLVEFPSVVDAVQCAVEIQRAMPEREAEVREDQRIRYRIGINLGDIVIEGDDILGDGVNVAARLENLSEPEGLCISDVVHQNIQGKLGLEFEYLGEQTLKNMERKVRAWRWSNTASPAASGAKPSLDALPLPDKPSVAVLPFDNLSNDPEQEYFADGISEDLITALSKIRWFFVIARNSTFTYKGQAVEVTQVARELGVRYVLEGSVRKAGGRVRVTAQLVDAITGKYVWAERYDRDLADIFELQDEMTQTIVAAVEPELGAAERERAVHKPPEKLDAWETYQRGLWHMWSYTKDDNAKAPHLLRRAHELEPGFAAAYAHEAYSHYINVIMGWAEDPDSTLAAGMAAAKKALTLDDKDAVAYVAAGRLHMMLGEHDASIAALETSLTLNPNFAQAYYGLGFAQTLAGRLEDALDNFAKAERLSPRDPLLWGFMVMYAVACILSHEYEAAVHWAQRAIQIPRAAGHWPYLALAAARAHLDQMDEARAAVKAALEQKPDLSLSYLKKILPTKHPEGLDPYVNGLRKAGLPE